jgi:glycosyltransferase involved in cell wall biosynthesis
MRILHVYSGNLYGGVETFLSLLGRTSSNAPGIAHDFALCFEGRLSNEIRESQAALHLLGEVRGRQPWTVLRARRSLMRLLRGESFDAIICHSSWPFAIFAPIVRRADLPLIFYLHGPIENVGWVDRWASRTRPDAIVAVSHHTSAGARKLFADIEPRVLPYPLPWPISKFEISNREGIRRELGVEPDDALIIQVSRMDPWKGHAQSLEALAKIRGVPGWRCCIVGGAQRPKEVRYLAQLKQRVSDLGLSRRVQFIGERSDVPQLLGAADIFLQANVGPEGFSLAFMEAFAAGLPIVTTRLGGAGELIDETCGVFAEPGDVDAIAAGLKQLIENTALRTNMSHACSARVLERCDPQPQLTKLSAIITECVERKLQPAAMA